MTSIHFVYHNGSSTINIHMSNLVEILDGMISALSERLVDSRAEQMALQCRKDFQMSPWAINNGWCSAFASRLARRLGPEAKVVGTTGVPGAFPGHSAVFYKGLYYDAESPQGVPELKDLAYCIRLRAIADSGG